MSGTSLEVSNQACDSIWVRLNAAMCSSLPIRLLSFNAVADNNKTDLAWSTATESNNDHFTVQRSQDAIHFTNLANIKGAGNSSLVLHYSFTDIHPFANVNYYRIEQTDYDGQTTFSKTIGINYPVKTHTVNVFPNPANNLIQLSFAQSVNNFQVEIINTLGEPVLKTTNQMKMDISSLPAGMYFLKTTSGNNVFMNKFQKR